MLGLYRNVMNNKKMKDQSDNSLMQNPLFDSRKENTRKKFVLTDVSKDELNKRRIPIHPYLL